MKTSLRCGTRAAAAAVGDLRRAVVVEDVLGVVRRERAAVLGREPPLGLHPAAQAEQRLARARA